MSYISGPGKTGIKVTNAECGVPEQQPVRIDQVSGNNNLLEFYDIAGNLLSFVDNTGAFGGGSGLAGAVILAPATSSRNVIQPTGAAVVPLTSKGFAGQTADLQEWQSSAGAVLAKVDASGNITATSFVGPTTGTSSGNVALTPATSARNVIQPTGAAVVPLTSKGFAGQTANLLEFQSSAGAVLSFVDAAGAFNGSLVGGAISGTSITVPGAGAGSEKFGSGAASAGASATAVGNGASAAGAQAVAVGGGAVASGFGAAAFGFFSQAGDVGLALGFSSSANFNPSIALGGNTTAINQCVIGGVAYTISNLFVGNGVTAAVPLAVTINASGGSGTDIAGASLTLAGGKGTGAGTPGNVLVQVSTAGVSGTTPQTLSNVATFAPTGLTVTDAFGVPMGATVVLCSSFTPAGTGADTAEIVVPYSPRDGTTSITWNVRAIDFRVQTAGGAPAVTVEKSTAAGAFSAATVGAVTLASGAFEGRTTAALGTVASGNKLRFNVGTLATAQNWSVQVELGATT